MSRIISYQPLYKADFKRINLEAISETFPIEPHDREQLDHPETYILADGGAIFLAEFEGLIVGTVGMVHTGLGEYELVKLAVTKSWREIGLGRRLCEAGIDYARQNGARRVWLEANSALKPAIYIYESLGFEHIPLAPSLYARADVRMELRLSEVSRWRPQPLHSGWSVGHKL
jgi:putative acetyltransferase